MADEVFPLSPTTTWSAHDVYSILPAIQIIENTIHTDSDQVKHDKEAKVCLCWLTYVSNHYNAPKNIVCTRG
jgi:hypothetical protein